jgi:type II secretory pathway component GspD/PulD (secretin)
VVTGTVAATPVPSLSGTDKVGPMMLRDETISQVLELLQRWTGKTVLRPQALPASLYTLSLPASATRNDALLAIETLLSLNGVAVIQQGDKFLKVVPNQVAKAESPTLLTESALSLPASGRVASKIFLLKHANGQEVVAQIQGMLNTTLGTPSVFFSRNNAILVTDSIMNLQKIETLLAQLDRPQLDAIATKLYNLKHAMASDMVNKLTALLRTPAANGAAPFRLSTGTSFTADERTNRVIVMGSADQHPFFDKLIESLDATSDPNTKTDVVFLRHANATETASLLTQLITGQTRAASTANGGRSTTGTNRVTTPVVSSTPVNMTEVISSYTDEFIRQVTVLHDSVGVANLFCSYGILWGTVSQIIRQGIDIKLYFDYFVNLDNISVTNKLYFISQIPDSDIWINNALITWTYNYNGTPTTVTARMQFTYDGGCLYELYAAQLPSPSSGLFAVS